MKEFDCDLHFHGPYSAGVSKNMKLPVMAEQARLKGLHVLSSADILNQKWFDHVKENLVEEKEELGDKLKEKLKKAMFRLFLQWLLWEMKKDMLE